MLRENDYFWRRFFIYILLSCACISLDNIGLFSGVRRITERGLAPIQTLSSGIVEVASAPLKAVYFYRNGTARIADLEARLAELVVERSELLQLRSENAEMRKLLGVDLPPDWQFLPAKVITARHDLLLLSVGSNQGVKVGMTVVDGGYLVGQVTKVSEVISEITPVTAIDSVVSAQTLEINATGNIEGQNSNLLIMKSILQEEKVEPGQIVVSSGADGVMPDLPLGRVVRVTDNQVEAYKQAEVESLVNHVDIERAFVVVGTEGGAL